MGNKEIQQNQKNQIEKNIDSQPIKNSNQKIEAKQQDQIQSINQNQLQNSINLQLPNNEQINFLQKQHDKVMTKLYQNVNKSFSPDKNSDKKSKSNSQSKISQFPHYMSPIKRSIDSIINKDVLRAKSSIESNQNEINKFAQQSQQRKIKKSPSRRAATLPQPNRQKKQNEKQNQVFITEFQGKKSIPNYKFDEREFQLREQESKYTQSIANLLAFFQANTQCNIIPLSQLDQILQQIDNSEIYKQIILQIPDHQNIYKSDKEFYQKNTMTSLQKMRIKKSHFEFFDIISILDMLDNLAKQELNDTNQNIDQFSVQKDRSWYESSTYNPSHYRNSVCKNELSYTKFIFYPYRVKCLLKVLQLVKENYDKNMVCINISKMIKIKIENIIEKEIIRQSHVISQNLKKYFQFQSNTENDNIQNENDNNDFQNIQKIEQEYQFQRIQLKTIQEKEIANLQNTIQAAYTTTLKKVSKRVLDLQRKTQTLCKLDQYDMAETIKKQANQIQQQETAERLRSQFALFERKINNLSKKHEQQSDELNQKEILLKQTNNQQVTNQINKSLKYLKSFLESFNQTKYCPLERQQIANLLLENAQNTLLIIDELGMNADQQINSKENNIIQNNLYIKRLSRLYEKNQTHKKFYKREKSAPLAVFQKEQRQIFNPFRKTCNKQNQKQYSALPQLRQFQQASHNLNNIQNHIIIKNKY